MKLRILFAALLIAAPAFARDDGRHAGSPLKPWFESLKSGKGPCCSDADGTALSDADWESRDGHYRVRIEDQWWEVPDEAVITEPNRAGRHDGVADVPTLARPYDDRYSLLHARKHDLASRMGRDPMQARRAG